MTEQELLTFIALIVAASQYNVRGRGLWRKENIDEKNLSLRHLIMEGL